MISYYIISFRITTTTTAATVPSFCFSSSEEVANQDIDISVSIVACVDISVSYGVAIVLFNYHNITLSPL